MIDIDSSRLVEAIEWGTSSSDAEDYLSCFDADYPITRALVLDAIETLTRYVGMEDPREVVTVLDYEGVKPGMSCPRPPRGTTAILHILVDLLSLLVKREAEEAEEEQEIVEVRMTRCQARQLWNYVMGEDVDVLVLAGVNRFDIEEAIG